MLARLTVPLTWGYGDSEREANCRLQLAESSRWRSCQEGKSRKG